MKMGLALRLEARNDVVFGGCYRLFLFPTFEAHWWARIQSFPPPAFQRRIVN